MKVLVINAGSSSIKYQLFEMSGETVVAAGLLQRIGETDSHLDYRWQDAGGEQQLSLKVSAADHHQGMELIVEQLNASGVLRSQDDLLAVGHRVVHGGEAFHRPVVVNAEVLAVIEQMIPLAPLHNPANLEGINVSTQVFPRIPQVAVFDTAFHQSMPEVAFRYAVPDEIYRDYRVRRYGFHGSSHHFVAKQAAITLGRDLDQLNLITLHLGNGCSAAAIQAGQVVDTSMGMTPLEGLVMGTRCGDIDPALIFYLQRETDLSRTEVENLLNKQSGLKGICGVSDMREVHQRAEQGDAPAQLAREIFAYRIKKYIGAYLAVLGRLDGLVFTGGIGENDAHTRARVCAGLQGLGISLDSEANSVPGSGIRRIEQEAARVAVMIIPTNEELEIARNAIALVREGEFGVQSG
jgi:acetate kinase